MNFFIQKEARNFTLYLALLYNTTFFHFFKKVNTMKKTLFIWLTIGLAITTFYFCTQESTPDYNLADAQKIIDNFNSGKLDENKGEYLTGRVEIGSFSNMVVVAVINEENNTYMCYNLQLESKLPENLNLSLGDAQVLFFRDHLFINAIADQKVYLLQLNSAKINTDLKIPTYTTLLTGYGLGRYPDIFSRIAKTDRAATILPIDPDPGIEEEFKCKCRMNANPDTGCSSGGSGASSCSVGGSSSGACSVSCESGTYACCQ